MSDLRQRIEQWVEDNGVEDLYLMEPEYDEAILGIVRQFSNYMVLYDQQKVLDIMVDQGMEPDAAIEYFEFNTVGAWVGPSTPSFFFVPEE